MTRAADARPRVLMLTPFPPYPFDGGSKRIYSLCRYLRERFRFSLLTFRPRALDIRAAAEDMRREQEYLEPVFENVHWVEPPAEAASERVEGVDLPEEMRRFYSPEMAARLQDLTGQGAADLLHVEYDLMAVYARSLRGIPRLLTQHDMGGISFFHSYFREMAGWRKFSRVGEWLRRRRFVRQAGGWFDRIVVMTDRDRATLSRWAPLERIRSVPTGVDIEYFQPAASAGRGRGARLVYVGHYPHYPNEAAVLYFCREILPLISRRRPDVDFHVVGSSPTENMRRALRGNPAVRLTGTVPEVKSHLAGADVFVAPIQLGHGIKGKILEAFAMGLPVVATARAAAGLNATPGRDLLVADRPAGFAEAVLRLLACADLRARIGAGGLRVAREYYDWRVLAGRLGEVYSELI